MCWDFARRGSSRFGQGFHQVTAHFQPINAVKTLGDGSAVGCNILGIEEPLQRAGGAPRRQAAGFDHLSDPEHPRSMCIIELIMRHGYDKLSRARGQALRSCADPAVMHQGSNARQKLAERGIVHVNHTRRKVWGQMLTVPR